MTECPAHPAHCSLRYVQSWHLTEVCQGSSKIVVVSGQAGLQKASSSWLGCSPTTQVIPNGGLVQAFTLVEEFGDLLQVWGQHFMLNQVLDPLGKEKQDSEVRHFCGLIRK